MIVPDELSLADAWEDTLTGDCSFYRSPDGDPYRHFETGVAASETLIPVVQDLLAIAESFAGGPLTVIDVGSGAGGLLTRLANAGTDARLIGIDLRARPVVCTDPVPRGGSREFWPFRVRLRACVRARVW